MVMLAFSLADEYGLNATAGGSHPDKNTRDNHVKYSNALSSAFKDHTWLAKNITSSTEQMNRRIDNLHATINFNQGLFDFESGIQGIKDQVDTSHVADTQQIRAVEQSYHDKVNS